MEDVAAFHRIVSQRIPDEDSAHDDLDLNALPNRLFLEYLRGLIDGVPAEKWSSRYATNREPIWNWGWLRIGFHK